MVRHDLPRYTEYPRHYLVRVYEAFHFGIWERDLDVRAVQLDRQAENITFIGVHRRDEQVRKP